MSLESLKADPEFQALPEQEQREYIQQFQREENQKKGVLARSVGPPQRTRTPFEEVTAPAREAITEPTFTETVLPKNIATQALSGLEKGGRFMMSGITGIGNLAEQALEQAPRLVGQEPASTPVSRAVPQALSMLPLPGVHGAKAPPVTAPPPAPLLGGARAAAVARINQALGVTPESQVLAQTARETGVPITIGEARQSPFWTKAEATVERLPIGSAPMVKLREAQRSATAQAGERLGTQVSPRAVGAMEAGEEVIDASGQAVRTAEAAERSRKSWQELNEAAKAEAPARQVVEGLSPRTATGLPTTAPLRDDVVTQTRTALKKAEDAARAEASRLYREAEDLAGDAPAVSLNKTGKAAEEILTEERALGGLAERTLTRAARGAENVAGTAAPTVGGQPMDFLKNLPPELIRQYGLDSGELVTYRGARALESRIGGLIRASTDDNVRRQLRNLRDAIRADLDDFADTVPGELGTAAKTARDFYRTRVAEPFGAKSDIRKLVSQKEPAAIEKILLDPNSSARTLAIKAEMDRIDPTAWVNVQRHFGERLLRKSTAAGAFDPDTFAREMGKYPTESLRAILGDKADDLIKLVDRYRTLKTGPAGREDPILARAIFRSYATKNAEEVVLDLGKRKPDDIEAVKGLLTPEQWRGVGRAWWDDIVLKKALTPQTGVFSRTRFLTELERHHPDTLRALIGPEATEDLEKLRGLLRAQEKVRPLGDNPSGTGQSLLSVAQYAQMARMAGSIFVGHPTAAFRQGMTILTPFLLSRLLASPRGIRLLTEGMQAPQGSKAATDAAIRIGLYLGASSGTNPPGEGESR